MLQSAALHRLHMASSRRPAESARHPCTPNPTAQQQLQHKAVIPLQENLRITKKNMNLCFLCNCWRVQTAFQDTVWMLLLFIYLCKYSALARSETSCRQFHMVDGKRVVPPGEPLTHLLSGALSIQPQPGALLCPPTPEQAGLDLEADTVPELLHVCYGQDDQDTL